MWERVVCLCGSHPQASHQSLHLPPLSPQSILIGYLKCQHATLQQHIKKSTVSNKHSVQTTVQSMFSSGQTITMHQNPQIKPNQNLKYQFGNSLQQWKKDTCDYFRFGSFVTKCSASPLI